RAPVGMSAGSMLSLVAGAAKFWAMMVLRTFRAGPAPLAMPPPPWALLVVSALPTMVQLTTVTVPAVALMLMPPPPSPPSLMFWTTVLLVRRSWPPPKTWMPPPPWVAARLPAMVQLLTFSVPLLGTSRPPAKAAGVLSAMVEASRLVTAPALRVSIAAPALAHRVSTDGEV